MDAEAVLSVDGYIFHYADKNRVLKIKQQRVPLNMRMRLTNLYPQVIGYFQYINVGRIFSHLQLYIYPKEL